MGDDMKEGCVSLKRVKKDEIFPVILVLFGNKTGEHSMTLHLSILITRSHRSSSSGQRMNLWVKRLPSMHETLSSTLNILKKNYSFINQSKCDLNSASFSAWLINQSLLCLQGPLVFLAVLGIGKCLPLGWKDLN
jgi:hypothetical protein